MTKTMALCCAIAALGAAVPAGVAQNPDTRKSGQHQAMPGMTDAEFLPLMIQHHQDGIEMARLEEQRGSSRQVKALAARIRQSQEKEVTHMRSLAPRGAAPEGTSGHASEHRKAMEQQSQAAMQKLKGGSGEAVDRAFLQEMAKHHQMAIDMIQATRFTDAELQRLARQMAAAQREELNELKKLEREHQASK